MEKYVPLSFGRDEIIAWTPEWHGDRFDDGRPWVPDSILDRMARVTLTEAWSVLRNNDHEYQFEGEWMCTQPGKTLVGRAVTAVYMPLRSSLKALIFERAERAGCIGDHVSWPIDTLVTGDVYVADVLGEIDYGAVVGDNLSTSVYAKTGKGVIHDGSVRDLEGVRNLEGFVSFFRCYNPRSCARVTMLMGINSPIRIGHVTVMPGDVVLGKDHGVVFVPPHLAEIVVTTSEIIRVRDIFGKQRLREGKYTPGEIDRRWEQHIEDDFAHWAESHIEDLPVPPETIHQYLSKRTW